MRIRNTRAGTRLVVTEDKGRYLLTKSHYEPDEDFYVREKGTPQQVTLALATAFHGRERLTRKMAAYYAGLGMFKACNASATGIRTDGWDGWTVKRGPSVHVSDKLNHAVKMGRPHSVCIIGSDDFLSVSYIEHATKLLKEGYDFVGASGLYMHDERSGETVYVPTTTSPGCGRFLSARLLERLNYTPYRPKKSQAVDATMHDVLWPLRPKGIIVDTRPGTGFVVLDVKCREGDNIWPYATFRRHTGVQTVDSKIVEQFGL